jgi:SAM-dependent methyltransferase
MNKKEKRIIDVCCGGRMFWFDKENPDVLFVDIRPAEKFTTGLGKHKRNRSIRPDKVMDFRKLDIKAESFSLVVFDPPHLASVGSNSFTARTYGRLDKQTWRDDLRKGFSECFRILKPNGVLIFKWCEYEIPLREVLALTSVKPLFGHPSGKQQKTHWISFIKPN